MIRMFFQLILSALVVIHIYWSVSIAWEPIIKNNPKPGTTQKELEKILNISIGAGFFGFLFFMILVSISR